MGNTLIKANCVDQRLLLSTAPVLASGGINEDVVEFHFCPLWEGFSKTAVFYRDEKNIYYSVVGSDDRCTIPAEVLQSEGDMFFGVFGTSGSVTRTSEILRYKIKQGAITENLKPSEPAPDIYIQILEALSEMNNKVDKVDGKGLSTNDYTDTEKTKLAGIADGATKVIIDSTLKNSGQAADAKETGNRLNTVEAFTVSPSEYELTGNLVQLNNYEGMPMNCVTAIEPIQSGSGDPSPDNIRPISGRTGAKLTRCGKNLIPREVSSQTNTGITFTVRDDGSIHVSGTASSYNEELTLCQFTFKAGQTYTLSAKGVEDGKVLVYAYVGVYQIVSSVDAPKTFTPNVTTQAPIKIQVLANATVDHTIYPQLELGSTATEYEPYTGDTFAADFGQTVYGGTLDWNTGELTVERMYKVLDGTNVKAYQTSAASGKGNAFIVAASDALMPSSTSELSEIACSHYKTVLGGDAYNGVQGICIRATGAEIFIYDAARSGMTATEYNAWLAAQNTAGTPVQVCYKLATPTTVQLTPNEIAALAGENNIWSDAGEMTVSGRKDILWLTSNLIKRVKELESTVISLGGNV